MNEVILTSGCYAVSLGSDYLWWLTHHLIGNSTLESFIILPTQRAADRLRYLIDKKLPYRTDKINIITYEMLSNYPENSLASLDILWELSNNIILEDSSQTAHVSLQQRQQWISCFNSTLNELYAYEVTPEDIPQTDKSSVQLHSLFQSYETLLAAQQLIHPTKALIEGIKAFQAIVPTLKQKVYLIIDGLIPPALQELAVLLASKHYIFIIDNAMHNNVSSCYKPLYTLLKRNDVDIKPLESYTYRKPLIEHLQTSIFQKKSLSKFFENISMIETSNELALVDKIVNLVQASFEDGAKSITVVTSNRQLSKFISLTALAHRINVDDTCGIPLSETQFGYLLLNLLRWILSSGNYKELLNLIGHSLLKAYWKELPARLDKWGRLQQMSFKEAISTYISQDDEEKEKLKILMESLMQPLSADFHPVLSAACEMLNTWGIHEEDYPEYKEIINIANMVTDIQMLEFMLQSTMYRLPTPTGVCIRIMGPLEVRLMQPERVIIADMNEGEWPLSSASNPWLHPKLREDLNLSSADYITAVSSKLFLSLLGCKYVYLCRTTHKNGQVTKASRWWDRIKVLAQLNNVEMFQDENDMLSMQGDNGIISHFRIPEHLIPRRLSISQLHLWINNPTQFILSCILKLEELPEWEKKADNRDKGIIIHEVLEQGVSKGLSLNEMLTLGYSKLQTLTLDEHQRMFWESYITTCIHHFHKLQASAVVQRSWTEVKGEWRFNTQFGAFTLVGKADRIDLLSDGSLHIIDYKTGTVPSKNAVYKGLIPQLPVLGLIAMYGGFEGIQANAPFMLSYWDLKEGSASHILFDDIRHLEAKFIQVVEQLLDPNAAFELDSTSKLNI